MIQKNSYISYFCFYDLHISILWFNSVNKKDRIAYSKETCVLLVA